MEFESSKPGGEFLDIHHRFHLRNVFAIVLLLFVFGIFGYMILEGWSFHDAIYMVVITLSTVGFKEVHDLSMFGRYFTIAVIVCGVSVVAYVISVVTSYLISGKLKNDILHNYMKDRIKKLNDHVIVCGFGGLGRQVSNILHEEKMPFIIIERSAELVEELENRGVLFLFGDATEAEVLQMANIKEARAFIITTNDDTENIFLTLAARHQSPNIQIVSRASRLEVRGKLIQAGADRVVMPHKLGAYNMATMATMPALIDFFDILTDAASEHMRAEELRLQDGDRACNKPLKDFGGVSRVNILAVLRKDGSNIVNPDPEFRLAAGDTLIMFGSKSGLDALAKAMTGTSRQFAFKK